MKRLAKILSVLVLLCCLTGLFAACGNSNDIVAGTYYLENDDDSYIVLTEETMSFHNVDFSEVEQTISDTFGETVDVAGILAGEQTYVKANSNKILYIDVYEGIAARFHYDGGEKTLTFGDQKYILREE